MGTGTSNPILQVLILCVLGSVILAAIGFWLRSRGQLRARGPALGWAILTLLPLFGAAVVMMTKHEVEMTSGETPVGQTAHTGH